jgi:prevent-host-death family protein
MYNLMYTLEMKKVHSVGSARANLPAIIDDVQSGRVIQVTRRGQPVAVIMSPAEYATLERRQSTFGEACAEFRARFGVHDLGLDRGFFRALRDQKPGRKVRL